MSAAGVAAMHGEVLVSPITVWETTRKASIGKLPPLPTLDGSFARHLEALGLRSEPLIWQDAETANRLPMRHADPMDRMLVAVALRLGCPVITNDRRFAGYEIATIW